MSIAQNMSIQDTWASFVGVWVPMDPDTIRRFRTWMDLLPCCEGGSMIGSGIQILWIRSRDPFSGFTDMSESDIKGNSPTFNSFKKTLSLIFHFNFSPFCQRYSGSGVCKFSIKFPGRTRFMEIVYPTFRGRVSTLDNIISISRVAFMAIAPLPQDPVTWFPQNGRSVWFFLVLDEFSQIECCYRLQAWSERIFLAFLTFQIL